MSLIEQSISVLSQLNHDRLSALAPSYCLGRNYLLLWLSAWDFPFHPKANPPSSLFAIITTSLGSLLNIFLFTEVQAAEAKGIPIAGAVLRSDTKFAFFPRLLMLFIRANFV